ncbi:glyoxylase I 4 isoform X2 [Andrographis paniculata]|uniref:glyoxylase I 4 isoform X2 n=1 Tax=Andrographis paniculata TaxID=175694 RepID=UPI0021E9611B|nr:glyoxylase I 4 isoform X2 [Andrographis paniculata]
MQVDRGEGERHDRRNAGGEDPERTGRTPIMALNHVSRVCRSVAESVDFYSKILGFVLIERPESFDFDGAWLFNYGVGIHLMQCKDDEKLPRDRDHLDPMDNHISFQCEDMEEMVRKLKNQGVNYLKRTVGDEEDGVPVIDQLFFNDPDGFMIEICNCENMKLRPRSSMGKIKLPSDKHNPPVELGNQNVGDYSRTRYQIARHRFLEIKPIQIPAHFIKTN